MSTLLLPNLWIGPRVLCDVNQRYDRYLFCDNAHDPSLIPAGGLVAPLPEELSLAATRLALQASAAVTGWMQRQLKVLLVSVDHDERAGFVAALVLMTNLHIDAGGACDWLRVRCGREVLRSAHYKLYLAQFDKSQPLPLASGF